MENTFQICFPTTILIFIILSSYLSTSMTLSTRSAFIITPTPLIFSSPPLYQSLYFSSLLPMLVQPWFLYLTSWRQHMSSLLLASIDTNSLPLPTNDPTFTVQTINTPPSPLLSEGRLIGGHLMAVWSRSFLYPNALSDRQPSPFIWAWDRHCNTAGLLAPWLG